MLDDFGKFYKNLTSNQGYVGMSALRDYQRAQQTPYILEEREMHVTQMDVFSRLLKDRKIYFASEVDSVTCSIVNAQLMFLASESDEPISIYVDSPGGACSSGYGLVETMGYIKPKIETVNMGMAASMGSLILVAGSKGMRRSLPGSRVLIHQPRIGGGGVTGTAADFNIENKEMQFLKEKLYRFIAMRTGQTYERVIEDTRDGDFWLSAEDSLKYGCIDEIIKIDWSKK